MALREAGPVGGPLFEDGDVSFFQLWVYIQSVETIRTGRAPPNKSTHRAANCLRLIAEAVGVLNSTHWGH